MEEGFKAVSLAFKILSNPVERFSYDLELIKGQGTFDLSDIDLPSFHIRSRPKLLRYIHTVVWTSSKLLLLVLGVFALAILFGLKLVKNLVAGLASFLGFNSPPQPKRQIKWCDNCKEYHNINLEGMAAHSVFLSVAEGEIWEENGKYFLRKDNQILDITTQLNDYIQQNGLVFQEGDSDDSNSADELDSKNHKGKKDKFSKKKSKVTKRK